MNFLREKKIFSHIMKIIYIVYHDILSVRRIYSVMQTTPRYYKKEKKERKERAEKWGGRIKDRIMTRRAKSLWREFQWLPLYPVPSSLQNSLIHSKTKLSSLLHVYIFLWPHFVAQFQQVQFMLHSLALLQRTVLHWFVQFYSKSTYFKAQILL